MNKDYIESRLTYVGELYLESGEVRGRVSYSCGVMYLWSGLGMEWDYAFEVRCSLKEAVTFVHSMMTEE